MRGSALRWSFAQPGIYASQVTLSHAEGCRATVAGPTFNVVPRAQAAFGVSPSGVIPADPGVVQVDNQSQNAEDYLWDFGDGTTSVFANLEHTYAETGTYEITLLASDLAGCTDTATLTVKVGEAKVYIPNVFTPNADGYNDEFRVRYQGPDNSQLLIVDRYGRPLFLSENDLSLGWDGSNQQGKPVPEGVYFYRLRIGEESYQGTLTLLR